MTNKELLLKLNTWPSAERESTVLKHVKYGVFHDTTLKKFNDFKGQIISIAIDFEQCIEIIILELMSRGDNNIKIDIYKSFLSGNNVSFASKINIFSEMIRNNWEPAKNMNWFLEMIHTTIRNFVHLRNMLAHSYVGVEIVKRKDIDYIEITGKLKDTNKIIFTNEFMNQANIQKGVIQFYLEHLRHELILKDTNTIEAHKAKKFFYTVIGKHIEGAPPNPNINILKKVFKDQMSKDFGVNKIKT